MNAFAIDNFREALNESFVLRVSPSEQLDLQLVAVEDLSTRFGAASRAFSATFRGPLTPWARQHTYELENTRLGSMHLFLVPLGPQGGGMLYEASFS